MIEPLSVKTSAEQCPSNGAPFVTLYYIGLKLWGAVCRNVISSSSVVWTTELAWLWPTTTRKSPDISKSAGVVVANNNQE